MDEDSEVEGQRGMIEKIILIVMLSSFSIIGSVGNGMVIFVFQRIRDKSTAQIFIIFMAIIDLFTCMVIIPFTMVVEYTDSNLKYDFFCKLYHFFISSKVPLSVFIMVAIAFDRYFCICHPLKRIMTPMRAKVTIATLSVVACILGVITSLFYSVYQVIYKVDTAQIDAALGTNFSQSIAHLDSNLPLGSEQAVDGSASDEQVLWESIVPYHKVKARIFAALNERNVSFKGVGNGSLPVVTEVVYTGICDISAKIVGLSVLDTYRPIHVSVWPVCLIIVVVLYLMIYRFMCLRRSKKLQQKLIMYSYVNEDGGYEESHLMSEDMEEKRKNCKNKSLSTTSIVGATPSTISTYELGSSAVVIKTTPFSQKTETCLLSEPSPDPGKHGNNLLQVDSSPKSKCRLTPMSTAVTPTGHEDDIPILNNFYAHSGNNGGGGTNNNNNSNGGLQGGRRHSHLPEQKYHWHKNRDSVKRYKGKNKRHHTSQHSYETERLREENRSANVRTALMLFTVTIVFVVAFVPAMLMAQRIININIVVFYVYFVYNVANPFIYAFMNQIFKEYMRKMFFCNEDTTPKRSQLTALTL